MPPHTRSAGTKEKHLVLLQSLFMNAANARDEDHKNACKRLVMACSTNSDQTTLCRDLDSASELQGVYTNCKRNYKPRPLLRMANLIKRKGLDGTCEGGWINEEDMPAKLLEAVHTFKSKLKAQKDKDDAVHKLALKAYRANRSMEQYTGSMSSLRTTRPLDLACKEVLRLVDEYGRMEFGQYNEEWKDIANLGACQKPEIMRRLYDIEEMMTPDLDVLAWS